MQNSNSFIQVVSTLNYSVKLLTFTTLIFLSSNAILAQQFGDLQSIPFGNLDGIYQVEVTDIDGDGDSDILLAFWIDRKMIWLENNGSNNFSNSHTIINDFPGLAVFEIKDLTNNGLDDIILVDHEESELSIYLNSGGTFTKTNQALPLEDGLDKTALYFINLDDDPSDLIDILLGTENELVCYKNLDGQGNFEKDTILNTAFKNPWSIGMADLDGDGTPEIYAAITNFLRIFTLNNTGTYDWDNLYNTGPGQVDLNFGDWNCDGYTDLIFTVQDENKCYFFENGPSGLATEPQTLLTNINSIEEFELNDVDGDGDIDMALAAFQNVEQVWLKNNCDEAGTIGELDNGPIFGSFSVELEDLDGDTIPDLVCVTEYDNSLYWFPNIDQITTKTEAIPAKESFSVSYEQNTYLNVNTSITSPYTIAIYDLQGKLVLKKNALGNQRFSIDNLANAFYLISVYSSDQNKRLTTSFVKI